MQSSFKSFLFLAPTKSHPGHLQASNLEEVAKLQCAQVNSASYPQQDRKWVVAYGLRDEDLASLTGRWYVCTLHRSFSCSLAQAIHGHIMHCGIISSCPICCHFWSQSHLSSNTASTRPLLCYLLFNDPSLLVFRECLKTFLFSCLYHDLLNTTQWILMCNNSLLFRPC